MNEITLLDLFSGVGGFAKGFEDAGLNIKHHDYSEIDKHAIAVYQQNFPKAKYVGDIRFISKDRISRKPNIITFGFPCQDLSVAGNGRGLDGARSGLFFEAIRLIEELKPEVFMFENVKGLLSNNEGKDFEIVLRAIANIGLYHGEWQLLNTSWFLPQNRERVYFVGHLRGVSSPGVFPFRESDFGIAQGQSEATIVRTITGGGNSGGHHSGMTLIQNFQGKETINTIRAGGKDSMTKKHNWNTIQITPVITPNRAEKRQNGRRFKEPNDPCFTLNCQDQHGIMIDNKQEKQIRRLTEVECERLQGFPDNWTKYGLYGDKVKKVPKTQRFKQMGNAVSTILPKLIAERLTIFK